MEKKQQHRQNGTLSKLKVYVLQRTVKKVKGQFTEWENTLESHISDLAQSIHLKNLKIYKKIKWAKDLNIHFSKGHALKANKHIKRHSASLIIMKIRTTMRYIFCIH